MARTVDALFVAMTRPATKFGVPWDGFIANAIFTAAFTILVVRRPPGFAIGILIHFILRELCRVDPHFFWRWRLFFKTKFVSPLPARLRWGGSRLQPAKSRVRKAQDFKVSL
jgi:type IV secretory pathway VirB3-like protein